jgi:hypothetical protein
LLSNLIALLTAIHSCYTLPPAQVNTSFSLNPGDRNHRLRQATYGCRASRPLVQRSNRFFRPLGKGTGAFGLCARVSVTAPLSAVPIPMTRSGLRERCYRLWTAVALKPNGGSLFQLKTRE